MAEFVVALDISHLEISMLLSAVQLLNIAVVFTRLAVFQLATLMVCRPWQSWNILLAALRLDTSQLSMPFTVVRPRHSMNI